LVKKLKKYLFCSVFVSFLLFEVFSFCFICCGMRVFPVVLVCLIVLWFLSCSVPELFSRVAPPCVVAHRGGASLAPENSLLAIERSIALGVDAVEIDVRLTADAHPVVMHDSEIDRTTDGKGRVSALMLHEVKSFNLLGPDGNVTSEKIPTLEEVLMFVRGRCMVLIEIKGGDDCGIERRVLEVVDRCRSREWVAVQSFSDGVLERFCDLNAPFPLEKLFVFKLPFLPYVFDGGFSRLSMDKYRFVTSFNINKNFARKGLVKRLKNAGKKVKVWTLGCGDSVCPEFVDGVITDFPQFFP
jgi:glycerophosphoryl diester phosphodiesterase